MAFPVNPNDFKAALAAPTGNICSKLVSALLKIPALLYQILVWAVDANTLAPTDELKAWLGLASGTSLSAPSSVTAVGAATSITISWLPVAAATSYDIYASLTPLPPTLDPANAIATGVSASPFVFDSSVASVPAYATGVRFYFWVVARNVSTSSSFSASATAIAGTIASPVIFGFGSGLEQSFTAPATGDYDFVLGAGGAGGGSSYSGANFGNTAGSYPGGGGGGSGSKWAITIHMTIGQVALIDVGTGGLGGPISPKSGSRVGTDGGDTFVTIAGVEQARAKGGKGGGGALSPSGGAAGPVGSGLSGSGTIGNPGSAGTTDGGGAGGSALAGLTGKGGQGGAPCTATTTTISGNTNGFDGEAGEVTITF